MIKISAKTLSDLEFPVVREQISKFAVTSRGKEKILQIKPFSSYDKAVSALNQTQEYLLSYQQESPVPNHGFDPIDREIKFLGIEEATLEAAGFRKIAGISETVNTQIRFFRKFQELYPSLAEVVTRVDYTEEIIENINRIVDRYGEVHDDASALLKETRGRINQVKGQINSSFTSALTQYNSLGYLDDIRETVVDHIRVLAVKAMHRRKVKGGILGNSKTGSIVYIQPEATYMYTRELNNLQYEESEEIKKILKRLTSSIRPFRPLLEEYQDLLSEIDVVASKVKYAREIDGVLPRISQEREIELREAYHPLLLLNNRRQRKKTFPQTLVLNEDKRIIVISGPNAGGKSITLKTVGLLQLMLQSGMLIPVHPYSRVCLFDKILTDIGDNQSIENHLSTYSYRLKNMNSFLRKCDDKTLFLIDEFGTGSDPELGGALAETFLEVFYERGSFGILTTHYANLKMLANELPHMTNANMLFDSKTLEPLYKLHLGEAGSSFTFEVAQKNGIPFSLINRSKKKVERGKIRFDKSIADLQKERSKLQKTTSALKNKEQHAEVEKKKLAETNSRIQQKLESFQELYDSNQRLIYLGSKINDLSEKYFNNKRKKDLIGEFLKIVEMENSKRKKQTAKEKKSQKEKEEKILKEAESKVKEIRQKKKREQKEQKKNEKEKPRPVLKAGDRVRLPEGKAVGTIDSIEKGNAKVNYGIFTTSISVDQLELVQKKKQTK